MGTHSDPSYLDEKSLGQFLRERLDSEVISDRRVRSVSGARRTRVRLGGHVPPVRSVRRMVPSLGAGAGAWCPAFSRLKRQGGGVVRAEGLEPSRAVKLNGFSYRLRLSPPRRDVLKRPRQVCGLDYPFTVSRNIRGLGAARLVSTPSRSVCSGLGSGLPSPPARGQV